MDAELKQLLEQACGHVMSEQERTDQALAWAHSHSLDSPTTTPVGS